MGGFAGALKTYGKKRVARAKQRYGMGGDSSSGGSSGGGVASEIIKNARERKRGGKTRG